jgi:hypothetical protein
MKYIGIALLVFLNACTAKEPPKIPEETVDSVFEDIPAEGYGLPLTESQIEAWKEEDYPLSWYEGIWLSLSREYDSTDKDGYLKIEKVGEEYQVEQKYQGEIQKGVLYKEEESLPPYNEPGVFLKTDKFIYQVSVVMHLYYVYNKSLSLSVYAIDVAGYQRESIVKEVEKNDWWNKRVE